VSPALTLGAVIGDFKSISAIGCNRLLGRAGQPFWQRTYYQQVIRNERSLDHIRQYILENPRRWAFDRDNPTGRPDKVEIDFWRNLESI
jgi:hypothetical protein